MRADEALYLTARLLLAALWLAACLGTARYAASGRPATRRGRALAWPGPG